MPGDWLYIFGIPALIAYVSARWMEARNAREVAALMIKLRDARKGGLVQNQELVEARRMLALALQGGPHSMRVEIHHQCSMYLDACNKVERPS